MTHPIVPSNLPPPRLLLVDDDVVLRDTLSPVLQNEGFKVTTAASGEEAEKLLLAAKPPFELVLTDLVMPGKTGMDVLRCALQTDPSCTVLVLTGFGSVREATEAMDEGAYGLVTKPLQLDQFRNTLRRLLERSLLIHERDQLRALVATLTRRVEEFEGVIGRMEMLAKEIAPRPGPAGEGIEDLQRLAGLKERGLLTEEQFEASKKALLREVDPVKTGWLLALSLAAAATGARGAVEPPHGASGASGAPGPAAQASAKRTDAQARELATWALEQADPRQQRETLEVLKNHRFKNAKSPDREKVIYAQAVIESRSGRAADSAASFRRLERYFPASPGLNDGMLVLAEDALERKRPREAEARLRRALASEIPVEEKRKAQELMLWTLVEGDRPKEGIPIMKSLLPLAENQKPSERGLAAMVQVLCAAREMEQAEGACKDYKTFYPKGQYRGRVNLAWARLAGSLGDAQDSARSLQQVIQDAPLSPEADEARLALATLLSEGKLAEDAAANFPPPDQLLWELGNLEKRSEPGARALLVRMRLAMGKRDWGLLLAMVGQFRTYHGPETEAATVRELRAKAVSALAQESLEQKHPGAFLPYLDKEGVNSLSPDQRQQFVQAFARSGLPGPAGTLCQLAPPAEQPLLRKLALEEVQAGLHPEETGRLLTGKAEGPMESLRRAQSAIAQQDWKGAGPALLRAKAGPERLDALQAYLQRPLGQGETPAARAKEADTFLARSPEKGKDREALIILVADLNSRAGEWKRALALYPADPDPAQRGWVVLMRATCLSRLGQKDAARAALKAGSEAEGFKREREGLGRQLGL